MKKTNLQQSRRLGPALVRTVALLALLTGLFVGVGDVQAQGGLTLEIIAAPNLVVDSNALATSTYAPKVATVIAKVCNTSGSDINNVVAYIGDYTNGTPGKYPESADPLTIGGTTYVGGYQFTHLGPTRDATRAMGTLAADDCRYQYWSFEYPHYATDSGGNTIPTWGNDVKPDDDLYLNFDMWVTGDGTTTVNDTHTMYMRNEISAMANKIKPNGNPAGEWFNTETSTVNVGERITTNGILYRLGNINQGFDNDGDGVPDYNAWLQPFGDPAYDPACFRLVNVSGELTVERGAGNPDMTIPIDNNLYFTNLPPDNTDVRGVVYYEFMALGGECTIPISPYQEVASGFDNEKFNGDYGTGVPALMSYDPLVTLDKTGPNSAGEGTTITYQIPFVNTSPTSEAGMTLSSGGVNAGLMISDTVPIGLQYVGGSAGDSIPASTNSIPTGNSVTIRYSTDGGTTFSLTDPGTTPSSAGSEVVIQWWLNEPLEVSGSGNNSGFVRYQAAIPSGYLSGNGDPFIENCAEASFGDGYPFAEACKITMVEGTNSIGDFVWKDEDGDGNQDGGAAEPGINGVTVKLYWDKNNNGSVDAGEPEINADTTTESQSATIANGMVSVTSGPTGVFAGYDLIGGLLDINGDGTIDTSDTGAGLIGGYNATTQAVVLYNVVNGYVDVNGNGTPNEAGDAATMSGTYGFAYLPNARYVVEVTATDTDIPTGYTPTTPTTYAVDLSSGGNNRTSDFGFGPTLALNKYLISDNPAYEGDEVTFNIDLINTLPGDGTASGFCQYTIWATAAGTHELGTGWTNQPNAYDDANGPNAAYANLLPASNNDQLSAGGFSLALPSGTTIRKVEAIYSIYIDGSFSADQLNTKFWKGATEYTSPNIVYSTINAYGPGQAYQAIYAWDVTTGFGTWAPGDFNSSTLEVGFYAKKAAQGDTTLHLDALGFRITTDQMCGGADTTIAILPLEDTYDASKLEFVSASPAETSVTTGGTSPYANTGTITWADLGPLYAGGTKTVQVTFKALDPGADSATTTNDADVTEAKFATGRDVNDANDDADVTIIATGSIAGTVWSEGSGGTTGWVGTTGYESLGSTDFGIPGAAVTLYGCYDSDPTTGGTLVTLPDNNKTCAQNGAWYPVPGATATTDEDGYYIFEGLLMGYYYTSATLPAWASGASQSAEPVQDGTGLSCIDGNATCDGTWNPSGSDTVDDANLRSGTTTVFNPIGTITTDGSLITPNEDITEVNFGYENVPAYIYGKVYTDSNGDGDQDDGEADVSGVTVRLCSDATCSSVLQTTTTGSDGTYGFSVATPSGSYYVQVNGGTPLANTIQTDDPDSTGTCSGTGCDNRTEALTLTAGQSSGSHDFGYQPNGSWSIGDTVYKDWDGDGTQDAGDPGIPNITVYLYEDEDNDGVIDSGIDALIATDATGTDGTYSFDNLTDGNYIVVVNTADADFPTGVTQTGDPDGTCPGTACDSTSTSAAISGADDLDNDFGYQPRGQGTIGDYVWLDSDGDAVQDASESGQPNVTVYLYHDADGDGTIDTSDDALVATATTLGYSVIDGYIDTSGNGSIGAEDALGDLYGYQIIAGAIDVNGDGSITTADDGTFGPYTVVDGCLDMDGNGNATTDDDGDLKGFYLFQDLPAADYIVQVAPAELTTGGDLDTLTMTNTDAAYDADQTSRSVTLAGGQEFFDADFGFTSSSIGDLVWLDSNGDGLWADGEPGIAGVLVELYLDANNDGTADGSAIRSMQTMWNIIDGYFDVDGDGVTAGDAGDTGTISVDGVSYTVTNGQIDLNGGGIDGTDDGLFAGYTVIDGYFDVDGNGSIDGNDDADTLGIYLFGGLGANNYIVQVAASNFQSGGALYDGTTSTAYTQTYDPNAYNTLTPSNPSCLAAGATLCDDTGWLRGITAPDSTFFPGLQLGQNDMSQDFGYQPPAIIGDRIWQDLDGDGVQDAGEPGISGVSVYLCTSSSPCSPSSGDYLGTATTNDTGYYYFAGYSAGTYVVSVDTSTLPGGASGWTQTGDPEQPGVPCTSCDDSGNADTTGNVTDLSNDFGYQGSAVVSGTVFFDKGTSGGLYQSGTDTPFSGVPVYLYDNTTGAVIGYTLTDSNGYYKFNVAPGTYRIQVGQSLSTKVSGMSLNYEPDDYSDDQYCATGSFTSCDNNTIVITSDADALTQDFGYFASMDMGDLPSSYNYSILMVEEGPIHIDVDGTGGTSIRLGSGWDAELDGQPAFDAGMSGTTGDDNTAGSDDEDGVTFLNTWVQGGTAQLRFVITDNDANYKPYLVGWFDWNNDGDLYDAGEKVDFGELAAGTHDLNVAIPGGSAIGTINMRFRLYATQSPPPVVAPTGTVLNGEVEDYQNNNSPTAVELAGFWATAQDGAVLLTWETATELDNLGFNLYRAESPTGPRVRINAELIPSQVPGSPVGASYERLDGDVRAGTSYYYWLEAMDVYGHTVLYGPISASLAPGSYGNRVFLPLIGK